MIIISDGRGTLEIKSYTDDDGDSTIMINQTARRPETLHLALDADEARNLAAALIKFADEQDAAREAQSQQHPT